MSPVGQCGERLQLKISQVSFSLRVYTCYSGIDWRVNLSVRLNVAEGMWREEMNLKLQKAWE